MAEVGPTPNSSLAGRPHSGSGTSPQRGALGRLVMVELLQNLDARQREALRRYYLGGKSAADSCARLGLTTAQFDQLRAKVRTEYRACVLSGHEEQMQ